MKNELMHFNIIRQHTAQDYSHLLKINSCSTSHIQYSISVTSCKKTSLHSKRSQHPSSQVFYTFHTSIVHHYIYFKTTVAENKRFTQKYFSFMYSHEIYSQFYFFPEEFLLQLPPTGGKFFACFKP
jgi:hypothetical protein